MQVQGQYLSGKLKIISTEKKTLYVRQTKNHFHELPSRSIPVRQTED